MAVPVDMAKLLSYRNLALQLYCLRGSDVKHMGVFNFRRLMAQQQQEDEVFLAMHYSATCWWHCFARCFRRCCCCKGLEDEVVLVQVPVVVKGGGGGGGGDERGCCTREGSLGDMWRHSVPASVTPALSKAAPLASVAAPVPDAPAPVPDTPTGAREEHLEPLPLPHPVRFPDSGAVFPELIREHGLLLAAEVRRTRRQTEEGKEEGHRHHGMRRHGRLALALVGSLAVPTGTLVARPEATPSVHWLLCGLAVVLVLAYACAQVRVRRRRQRDKR